MSNRVYLAGSISENDDWRNTIIPGWEENRWSHLAYGKDQRWPILPNAVFGRFDYVGPYYDHIFSEDVVSICLEAIRSCDIFFAWFDRDGLSGSATELGYALGINKYTIAASPTEWPHDALFPLYAAHETWLSQYQTPLEALRATIAKFDLSALPYNEYLKSAHWQRTRQYAITAANGRCQVCNSDSRLHVHHRTYVNRGNEQPEDLIVLCSKCHALFHDNGKLVK